MATLHRKNIFVTADTVPFQHPTNGAPIRARPDVSLLLCLALVALAGARRRQFMPRGQDARATYLAPGLGIWKAMGSVYRSAQFIPSGLISVLFGLASCQWGEVLRPRRAAPTG